MRPWSFLETTMPAQLIDGKALSEQLRHQVGLQAAALTAVGRHVRRSRAERISNLVAASRMPGSNTSFLHSRVRKLVSLKRPPLSAIA
jgi:hypothetical protein